MKYISTLTAAFLVAGIISTAEAQNRKPGSTEAVHRNVHKEFRELENKYIALINEHEALLNQSQNRHVELNQAHLDRNRAKDPADKRKADVVIDRINKASREASLRIQRIGLETKKLDLAMTRLSRYDDHLIEGKSTAAGGHRDHDDDRIPKITAIDVVRTYRDASGKNVIAYRVTYADGGKRNFEQVVRR